MTDGPAPSPAERLLAGARTRLVLDHPFLGALALRLPLKAAASWCRTMSSDARALYYNPQWVLRLKPAHLPFVLANEALHCGLGHFARRGHRDARRWRLACDLAVNPLLVDAGLQPPPEATVIDLYRGLSAEEIYPCLDEESPSQAPQDEQPQDESDDGAGTGGGRGQGARDNAPEDGAARPPPLGGDEQQRLQQQWQRHLASAAQRAREVGKLSGGLARLVEDGLSPPVSWRAVLAQHLSQVARDDYRYARPSRREGEVLWPSLRSPSGDVALAIDTSGSIGDEDLRQFVAELNALKGSLSVRTTLLACDADLAPDGPWTAEPWEPIDLPRQFNGGGGTRFTPVFAWIEQQGWRPDALVYFTDGEGEFPAQAPPYPVLWIIKGRAPVPWGQRVSLS